MKTSVVVCTRNRSRKIIACLDSIAASITQASGANAEIVVVNNASTDDTYDVVDEWRKNTSVAVILVTEPKPGLNAARNCGLRTATGDIFVYTDDDCIMDAQYISQVKNYHETDSAPVLRCGSVYLGDDTDWPMTLSINDTTVRYQQGRKDYGHIWAGALIGCNMTFPRALFKALGYFDETFGNGNLPGADDTDYAYRAFYAGYLVEAVPDMIVRHYHGRRTAESVQKLVKNYLLANGGLYAKYLFKHPHVQRVLHGKNYTRQPLSNQSYNSDPRMETIKMYFKKLKYLYLVGAVKYFVARLKAV